MKIEIKINRIEIEKNLLAYNQVLKVKYFEKFL